MSSSAASKAAKSQSKAADAGIAEQRRQFDAIQKLLQPYVAAGTGSLDQQQTLLGLNGADAQAKAIAALQASPGFTSQQRAGTDAILANASATGGLRGGNVQAALGQFSPALLAQTINDQYARLGGLTSIGQNAAAGVGNAGMATGNNVTQLLQQQGAAAAGAALAGGRAFGQIGSAALQGAGLYYAAGGNPYTTPNTAGVYRNPGAGSGGSEVDPFGSLGGASTAGDFSDERLKTNIVPLGMTRRGNRVYRWDWKATGLPGVGVIAQEVEHIPGAVSIDPATGFKRVRYEKV